jgi:hypothetical protein
MKNRNKTGLKIAIRTEEKSRQDLLFEMLSGFLLSFLWCISFGGALCSLFSFSVFWVVPIGAALIFCLMINIGLSYKKFRIVTMTIPAAVALLLCIITGKQTLTGFCLTANRIFDTLGNRFGRIYPQYAVDLPASDHGLCSALFFIVITIILVYLSVFLVKRKSTLPSAVLLLLFAVLTVTIRTVSPIWLILTFIAFAALFIQNNTENKNKSAKQVLIKAFTNSVILVLAMVIGLGGILTGILKGGYFSGIRNTLEEKAEQIRYEKGNGNLPNGEFTYLGDFIKDEKNIKLKVVMTKPDSYYLRGFVGSVYNGHGWSELSSENAYKNADLFYRLHAENFYGQTQLAKATMLSNDKLTEQSLNQITINNISASSKYIYAPYEVYRADQTLLDADVIGDAALASSGFYGNRYYSYEVLPNQVKQYPLIASRLYQMHESGAEKSAKYLIQESYYNQFVYKNYTDIPDKARQLISSHLGKYDVNESGRMTYQAAKQKVFEFLATGTTENVEIREKDDKSPYLADGEDFLQLFLETTKKGYSVHYATAATLMFRYYGIAARYVEGYLITPDDVEGKTQTTQFDIADNHAHAWVEIYQDGIGWVPFEPTPSYFDVMEHPDDLSGYTPAKNESPTKQPEEQPQSQPDEQHFEQGDHNSTEIVTPKNILLFVLYLLIAALLVLVAIVIIKFIRKRIALKKKIKQFESDEYRTVITDIFAYTMELLFAMGLENENVSLFDRATVISKLSGCNCEMLNTVLLIQRDARFSNHDMTNEQTEPLKEFYRQVLVQFKSTIKWYKKIKLKLIDCLY